MEIKGNLMKKTYQITEKGKGDLEVELADLKSRRGEIAEKIAEARGYGDLSENAEYDQAREEQGLVETRIAEIEDILQNAEDIKGGTTHKVSLGSRVTLESGGKIFEYTVVGPVEADPLNGKISDESPLGVALIDKVVGDTAAINTPKGETVYVIKAIS